MFKLHVSLLCVLVYGGVLHAASIDKQEPSSISGCEQSRTDIANGNAAASVHQTSLAVRLFDQAHKLCPDDPAPLIAKARALLAGNQLAPAKAAANQVLATWPKDLDAPIVLANIYSRQNDYGPALRVLKRLLSVQPKDSEALLLLGKMEYFAQKPSQAERDLRSYLSTYADNREALYFLALAQKGKLAGSREALQTATHLTQLDPRSPQAHDLLGMIDQQLGDSAKAIEEFSRSAQLCDELHLPMDLTYSHLGSALFDAGKYHEALAPARKAVLLNPRSDYNQFVLGEILAQSGDDQGSIQALQVAVKLNPSAVKIHSLLAREYFKAGMPDKAQQEQTATDRAKAEQEKLARERARSEKMNSQPH